MTTDLLTIARNLDVAEAVAVQFCERVRRCFTARPPTDSEIARCLQAYLQLPAVPEMVAAVIRGDRGRRSKRNEPKRRYQEPPRDDWSADLDDDPGPLLNIQRYDPRKATAGMAKCPHGVLKMKKCRICNPAAFEAEYGES